MTAADFDYHHNDVSEALDLISAIRTDAYNRAGNIIVIDFRMQRMRQLAENSRRNGRREDAKEIRNLLAHAAVLAAPYRDGLTKIMMASLKVVRGGVQ